jgi:hypothetical protein
MQKTLFWRKSFFEKLIILYPIMGWTSMGRRYDCDRTKVRGSELFAFPAGWWYSFYASSFYLLESDSLRLLGLWESIQR